MTNAHSTIYFRVVISNQISTKHFSFFDFDMAQSTTYNLDGYTPRNPKASANYKCAKIILKNLSGPGMICMHPGTVSGGRTS